MTMFINNEIVNFLMGSIPINITCNCKKTFLRISNSQKLCSVCRKEQKREYQRVYQSKYKNSEKYKLWRSKHIITEKFKMNTKKARDKFRSKLSSVTEYEKEHRNISEEEFRRNRRKYESNKRKTDINYLLAKRLRNRIWNALGSKNSNSLKSRELLGIPIVMYKNYLENMFSDDMNWTNYGLVWEIDHIKPISGFDLTSIEEQKKAFYYLNTQPLLVSENRRKGAK